MPIGITVGSATNFFCKYSCGIKNLPINVVRGRKRTGYVRVALCPNITGCGQVLAYMGASFTGAFGAQNFRNNMYQGGSGPNHGQLDLIFSASTNNSIYSIETVQPAALQTLIIIKV